MLYLCLCHKSMEKIRDDIVGSLFLSLFFSLKIMFIGLTIIITGNSYLCGFIMKEGKKDDIKRS